MELGEVKRTLRALKQEEVRIRFDGGAPEGAALVWQAMFGLRRTGTAGQYSPEDLLSMSRAEYRAVVDEFFVRVYVLFYRENEPEGEHFDPAALAQLGLPPDADGRAGRRQFRLMAKQAHPDTGGDAARFIELMEIYRTLLAKQKHKGEK